MAQRSKKSPKVEKSISRYTYEELKEPRTPETGHTALLPVDEQVVTVDMDNGWSKGMVVGQILDDQRPVLIDMDPTADPALFWAGKYNKREIPVLPLQRNEIVSESRILRIVGRAREAARKGSVQQTTLFADLEKTFRESDRSKRVEFYTHEEGWKNKLICGDSLHLMESLLHYEGLQGQVQMVYIDPPYGINYDSNFQQRVDTVKNVTNDTSDDVLTIKAFRDTWELGIHSYLTYLRDRLFLARDLLSSGGSVFVQISDENVHFVKCLLDEILGRDNFVSLITLRKTAGQASHMLANVTDYLLWYAKQIDNVKIHPLFGSKLDLQSIDLYKYVEMPDGTRRQLSREELSGQAPLPKDSKRFRLISLISQGSTESGSKSFVFNGKEYTPPLNSHWKTTLSGLQRLASKNRIVVSGSSIQRIGYVDDFPVSHLNNIWLDTMTGSFTEPKIFTVQTNVKIIARCILMTTDPGDVVLDPTCGSGTTAYAAEKWGRRWITCDTSRVAINVARQRLLSSLFEHYKTRNGRVSSGFWYKTVSHVTMKSIANDLEPETVELVDQPEIDKDTIRVSGPFEVMSLGQYSVEDWKGYFVRDSAESERLKNYIDVICRLYRKDAAIQGAAGLVHAIAETEDEKIAISVGPLSGRVTAKQINDTVQDALAAGILEVHVLGWAFEANVGEVKSQLEARGKVKVELIMIRPDTLAEGLKVTDPAMLFSPLSLPDIDVRVTQKDSGLQEASVTLKGVALFDRKQRRTEYKHADSGYISAWYLDEDYDGDCFVDCQIFFNFKKPPNLMKSVDAEVSPEEFKLQLTSEPFLERGYRRIAVKVVDVFGNESTVVRELA